MIGLLRWFLQSPTKRHDLMRDSFMRQGFALDEAQRATRDVWAACKMGAPTPPWIMERLHELWDSRDRIGAAYDLPLEECVTTHVVTDTYVEHARAWEDVSK